MKVGDRVKLHGFVYEYKANGRLGILWEGVALKKVKTLYTQGLSLREVAERLSTPTHTISHSVIQQVINKHGLMRSHYKDAEEQRNYVMRNYKKIDRALRCGISFDDLIAFTGVAGEWLATPFYRYGIKNHPRRLFRVNNLSYEQINLWNKLLKQEYSHYRNYSEYRRDTYRLTNLSVIYHSLLLDRKGDMCLDHKFSVKAGFDARLPPRALAHPVNLHSVSRTSNAIKGSACSIEIKTLVSAYKKSPMLSIDYETEMNNVLYGIGLEPLR